MKFRVQPHVRAWVIRKALYFDNVSHEFRSGDIEISGSRVGALMPPGTSLLADGVDGSSLVCTPGLAAVEATHPVMSGHVPGESRTLAGGPLPDCITLAGVHCERIDEILRPVPLSRQRTVALLTFSHHHLEQVSALLGWMRQAKGGQVPAMPHPPLSVMPLLACGSVNSATELVEFAKFARSEGVRIGVRLSTDANEKAEFRNRFSCTESALLGYLLPADRDVTVFSGARLDQRDPMLLGRMGGTVALSEPTGSLAGIWKTHASLFMQARVALHVRRDSVQTFLSRIITEAAPQHYDMYVDALTRIAALSLGLPNVGMLVPGMKADFCVFERDGNGRYETGSRALLSLLSTRRPMFTLTDGRVASGVIREGESIQAAPAACQA